MEADPGRLRGLAAAVRDEAVRVRGAARRLMGVGEVRWHSPAGGLFRERVEERVHALRVSATRLDHAGDLLEAHARQVEAVVSALASATVTTSRAAAEAADHVRRAVRDVEGRVGG